MASFKSLISSGACVRVRQSEVGLKSASASKHIVWQPLGSPAAAKAAANELIVLLRHAYADGEIKSNADYNGALSAWLDAIKGR